MDDWSDELMCAGVTVTHGVSGALLTTFGSGGKMDLLAPREVDGVRASLEALIRAKVPYRVIGGGSNLLLPDEDYRGALLSLSRLSSLAVAGHLLTADAGVRLPLLAKRAAEMSLSGLEFASGIPAEVGGAVKCNAGAFGQMISDVLASVIVMDAEGKVDVLSAKEISAGYHTCHIPEGRVILSAVFALREGDRAEIEERMRVMRSRRRETQPTERSAGSVFRRVADTPAAVYIERTGLKGYRVGGAELSTVHCNFIVNRGGATTADYFAVAERVRERVREQSGVTLEYEVERICSPRNS